MNGIYLEAIISGGFWSDTKDPIYLGVYGKNGGREFALQVNGESPFTVDGATVKLILGQTSCNRPGLQVDNSLNLKENDPSLNPIGLNDIEFVYLRKFGGQTGNTDDWAEFSKITVIFRDSSGKLLRYIKVGRIHFAKEAGLAHWLTKDLTVPRCKVTIRLNNIHHIEIANHSAGNNWFLKWHMLVPPFTLTDNFDAKINPNNNNEEWNQLLNRTYSFEIEGCCGPVPIIIFCESRERDWPSPDDIGFNAGTTVVDCSIPNSSVPLQIQTDVDGNSNNKKSRLTYFFEIETECLD